MCVAFSSFYKEYVLVGVAQGVSGVGVPLYSFLLNARKCEKLYTYTHTSFFSALFRHGV